MTTSATDPATRAHNVAESLHYLKLARDLLRLAGAPRARAYVARALKSAEGAQRHALRGDIQARRRGNR
jgi:hypothetical protein